MRYLVFALASGTSWILYLHRYTWNFIRPQLESEYGLTNTQLEDLYSLFNISYAIGQIPSGVLCDLVGLHIFLFVIILLWSVILPTFGLASTPLGLKSCRLLFGASQAGCYPSLTKVTRNWFPRDSRTTVQGLVASFFGRSGGAMSSIIMGTVLMGWLGCSWRQSLVVLSIAGVVFAVIFLLFFRNSPDVDPRANEAERKLIREGDQDVQGAPRVIPLGRLLRNRTMPFFIIQQVTSAGADFIYVSLTATYFLKEYDLSPTIAGLLVSLPLWGGACGGVAGGLLNDYLIRTTGNRRWSRSLVGFSGKMTACLMMFLAIAQTNGLAAAIMLFVVKFFSDWSQPTVWGTSSDIGGQYTATVFSVINTAGSVGGILAPLAVGRILDYFATSSIIDGIEVIDTDYSAAFVLVAILYCVSALSWFLIDCTKKITE